MDQAITAKQLVSAVATVSIAIGHCAKPEKGREAEKALLAIIGHVQALEAALDETDNEDFFGTEGWRHRLGIGQ